ncbi:MAG: NAD-dependent epimerase/dehydratase family protein [Planctomycetota bacterium]
MEPATNRRDFLKYSAALAALGLSSNGSGLLALGAQATPAPLPAPSPAAKKLKLLILGGTAFLGPAIIDAAKARGHTMTLFNRGKTNPQLYPDLEKLRGDRDGKLEALVGRKWDAVIDTSAYVPREVKLSAELLAPNVDQYIFISSVSVYAQGDEADVDESSAVGKIDDETIETVDGVTYGPLKALCEQAAERALPGRVTNIRPGLIVGPGDKSDRFTYWPVRYQRGGEMLAPIGPDQTMQIIDVRDLGEWCVTCLEQKICGVYNAIGPAKPLRFGELFDACRSATGSDTRVTWVDAKFLEEQKIQAWADLPSWIPASEKLGRQPVTSIERAVAKGLKFRPIATTVADLLKWHAERGPDYKLKARFTSEREQAALAAWHARDKRG